MAAQERVAIEVLPSPRGWRIRATRFSTRKRAVELARELGQRIEEAGEDAELVVKDRTGQIRVKDSYGRDPRESRG